MENKIVYNEEKLRVRKHLEEMFAEYKCPHDSEGIHLQEPNSILYGYGREETMSKYIAFPEQLHDKAYIMRIAQKAPQILDIVGDELKNDGDMFLKLYKKKRTVAAYIGKDLRVDTEFLLKMTAISPKCWKYIVEKHYKPATFEQQLYVWCYYQLDNYEYSGTQFRACNEFRGYLGAPILMHLVAVMKEINFTRKKEEIIDFINNCHCYTVDHYYDFNFNNYDLTVALCDYIENRDAAHVVYQGLDYNSDDIRLAEIILFEKRLWHKFTLFHDKIRSNKEIVLRLIKDIMKVAEHDSIAWCILKQYVLYYMTGDLKTDEDINNLVKTKPELYNDWQKYEKFWKNRKTPYEKLCGESIIMRKQINLI